MHRTRCSLLLLGCLLVSGAAAAQAPLTLTLEDAVRRAVEQAPALADARAREAAATSTVASRAAAGVPTLTATGGYLRTNHVEEFGIPQADGSVRALFPDLPNNYRARAELGVPIYTSGRVGAAVDAARADARAISAEARGVEEDVRLDTIRAYWALATARERVAVRQAGLDRMDAWVGDVRARLEAGLLPPNDLLNAQAQRARQNVQLIQARNAAASAQMDLARAIGADLDQSIELATLVTTPLPGAADAATATADALTTRAREGRAERSAILARQQGLRMAAEAALAATRPQIAGVAAVEPSRPNPRFVPRTDELKTSWDLGVNVAWSLWDGGRARAERASLLAQADAAGHRLDDFDARVGVEVRRRLLDLESNRAAASAADEAVAAATEARRVIGERFAAGVATPTDVLDAQNALLQAELERTELAAAQRLAEARLLRSVGGL